MVRVLRAAAFAAVLIAVILARQAGGAEPAEEDTASQAGLEELDREDYAGAEAALSKAVAQDPEDYAAWFNLAFARTMLGNRAQAITDYEKVLALSPGLYEAQLNLGIVLIQAKETDRAVPLLEAAAASKPGEFRPNYYLAEALYDCGDDAGAEQYYTKATGIDPAAPDAQIGLGRARANQGKMEEALPCYRRAAQIDPEYRPFLIEFASRLEEKGRDQEAIPLYREFPGVAEAEERLGHLLLKAGQAAEALPHLRQAVESSPTRANRFALAIAYDRTDEPDNAVAQLDLALEEDPGNFDLLMMKGRIRRDQRKSALAAQTFLDAARLRPDALEAWRELAGMLILIEDYPRALAALDRLEVLGDPLPAVHFWKALAFDNQKMYKEALASYERYLELAAGTAPDEEFKARERAKTIRKELSR